MFKEHFEEKVDGQSGISILAYSIGNENTTRNIISINQSKDTDDEVEPCHLYLDISTTKKLLEVLQKAIKSFE